MDRQQGKTTNQILEAPLDATFVWGNSYLGYPRNLARYLNRADLKIVSLEWLRTSSVSGFIGKCVVIDHAAYLGTEHRYGLEILSHSGVELVR